ncbi:uncharacterized protein DS421_15g503590 [Arachis hypogaea]|nr:uncharacterized protein DS421_15g503590 [Arachis hypogaea]
MKERKLHKERKKKKKKKNERKKEGREIRERAAPVEEVVPSLRTAVAILLLAPPSRKLPLLLDVAVEIAKRDGSRVKGGRGLGATTPSSPLLASPVAAVQREASRGRHISQPCLPPLCRRGESRRSHRVSERESMGAEERKERPAPATAASAARNPAAAAEVCTIGKGFKLGFYSFGFREPFIVTACLFQLSTAAAACSELLHHRCRHSGHWEASRCYVVTGAAVAPIELRLCLEAVVAAGTVGIDAVVVE